MSVAEPLPPEDDAARAARVEAEANDVEIPEAFEPPVSGTPHKDVCKHCLRPVCLIGESEVLTKEKYPFGYCHWDGRIDQPTNDAYHVAELFVEPPVKWGFLDVKGKSNFEVTSGPSKVHSGWSGGGVA